MVRKTIEQRILTLEDRMGELHELPERVAALQSEFSQFRAEVRDEFSAIRGELAEGLAAVRGEMADGLAAVRGEFAEGLAAVRGEMGSMREDMAAFRADSIARDEEARRYARMLHEDVIARLALTPEGGPRSPRRRKGR